MTKPDYRVPTMGEIAALPWNGLKVVSTFSGGGGSCLGYRMAGYRVLWANEFVEEAQRTYQANHPASFLETRDIRQVKVEEILRRTGLAAGELDVFDGSPPCSSFSTAGARERLWGKVKEYSDKKSQRTDDLFFEYVRLLRGLKPKVFIAENVSGLVKGTAKGYFLEILRELKASGYRVKAAVLNASWLGVPQARERLIFIGVRDDLGQEPVHPKPFAYRYTLREALPWITAVKHGHLNPERRWRSSSEGPCPTIMASGATLSPTGFFSGETYVEAECDIAKYAIAAEWDKIGVGGQSEKYFQLVRPSLDKPCPTVTATAGQTGAAGICHPTERRKFSIGEIKQICSFPPDFVLTGKFQQQWERMGRSVPPLMMKAIAETVERDILRKIPPAQVAA